MSITPAEIYTAIYDRIHESGHRTNVYSEGVAFGPNREVADALKHDGKTYARDSDLVDGEVFYVARG